MCHAYVILFPYILTVHGQETTLNLLYHWSVCTGKNTESIEFIAVCGFRCPRRVVGLIPRGQGRATAV
jgi:hypothetical protein